MKRSVIITIAVVGTLTGAFASASAASASDHAGRCESSGSIVFTRFGDDGIPNLFSTSPCGGTAVQVTTSGAHHADVSAATRLRQRPAQAGDDGYLRGQRRRLARTRHHERARDERPAAGSLA